MWEFLRFRWRIWRLERAARADEKGTERAIDAARRRGAQDEIGEIASGSDAGVIRYRIRKAQSAYLISKAQRLTVPLPEESELTVDDDQYVLSHAQINQLRTAIRAEQKARWELRLMWLPIVGVVTGLMGALTALVAVLGKKAG